MITRFGILRQRILVKCLAVAAMLISECLHAQQALYSNAFPVQDVTLLTSRFKHARDLNIQTLLRYDVDRLLAPYRKEAGLPEKAPSYKNWDGLDGHIGGHYLSALAIHYAGTNNVALRDRLLYMISELNACQEANAKNNAPWGVGYIGGVPKSKEVWRGVSVGDFTSFHAAWVPWYNVHKMYAGLRDAWLYTGNEDAQKIFLKFCDWAVSITSALTEDQFQQMLATEHGGMNEVLADAYQMTKDEKYLDAAKRFSHRMLLDAMAARTDNLDNKHANTQVPKAIGFGRIGELAHDKKYNDAAQFFWETVTEHRSLAFGGNSRREFFPSASACTDFVNDVEGPESCNSYNMLKLTEYLFRNKPLASYADYYERALYNHILSTQHPAHGGYVYFTPARPRHYRVYSTPNEAMWCCVGSGMENHGRYSQFIYTHSHDSLFLNLFIPSELEWKEKHVSIRQENHFPQEGRTKLTITKGSGKFTLMIRYPSWVSDGEMNVVINGKNIPIQSHPASYIPITRTWKQHDVVDITLPMHTRLEHLPNVPHYVAFLQGPILLAAKTRGEDLKGLQADDSRWSHIAHGARLPIDKAPIIIENDLSNPESKLTRVKKDSLAFTMEKIKMINAAPLRLEPFYNVHDARYMMYWMTLTDTQYRHYLDSIASAEAEKLALQKRTVDFVAPGEQQPEADHFIQSQNSNTGNQENEFWRDARDGGYFSYSLNTGRQTGLELILRYWGNEWGSRAFDIYIDDKKLVSEDNTGRWHQSKFYDIHYSIPDDLVNGKDHVRIKFQSLPKNTAGAVYYIRLVKDEKKIE